MPVTRVQVFFTFAMLAALPALHARAQEAPKLEVIPQAGHTNYVVALTFSADGRRLLSSSNDHSVKLWDVGSGQLVRTFHGHSEGVNAVAFLPDGLSAVSASNDRTIRLWDLATGSVVRTLASSGDRLGTDNIVGAALSPDGTRVAAVHGNQLRLWDLTTGVVVRTMSPSYGRSLSFSPDGSRLLVGRQLWDIATGTLAWSRPDPADAVAFSRDGSRILLSSNNKLNLWDTATGQRLGTYEAHARDITGVAFSPDGLSAVSAAGTELKVWDLAAGTVLASYEERDTHPFDTVAFSPDGRHFATGGWDRNIRVWEASTGKLLRILGSGAGEAASVAFSPDGKRIVSGGGDKIARMWDVALGTLLRSFVGHTDTINAVAYAPDGRSIASGGEDHALKLWDVATGRLLRSFDRTFEDDRIFSIVYSADGAHLLMVGTGGDLTLNNLRTGAVARRFKGLADGSTSGVFSPDGERVLAPTVRDTLLMWHAKTGKQLRHFTAEGEGFGFLSSAFSPDGKRVLAGGFRVPMVLWEAATGRQVLKFETEHSINAVAFSPDGKRVLGAGTETVLKLWDASTGALLLTGRGHAGPVKSVAFSKDGLRIASGSNDGSLRIWDGRTAELLATLVSSSDGEWCALTPEGFFAASPNGAGLLSVVRGLEVYSIDQFYQQLYRPDVVRQKLSFDTKINERVKSAARNMNLDVVLSSKSPPDILIVSHTSNSEVNEGGITIEASLTDRGPDKGGGIGRIEWRVNDVTRVVKDLQTPADGAVTKVAQELSLPEGTSEIKLVAYNKANLAASLPAAISVTVKSFAPRPKPRLHILAVGVNDYEDPDIGQLKYSVADAKSVAAAFALRKSNQLYEDVVVHGPLLNADVTALKLQAEFERMSKTIRPDDVFILYLAGHGVTDNGRYYFVPHDAKIKDGQFDTSTGIQQDQLQQWLTLIPAFKSVMIYDTCESGSITEDRSTFRSTRQLAATEKLSRSMGRTMLAATSDVKEALEGYRNHGVFTYVLLDAFALGDDNKDGLVTTEELAAYIRRHLPALAEKVFKFSQEPQVKLFGAPFTLIGRADITQINKVR